MGLTLETFHELLAEKGANVDTEIEKLVSKTPTILGLSDVAWHTLGSGGKHLRSSICLLVTEVLGGNSVHALRFAAATEILHNFLLIHDDIEDGDIVRRNLPAAWVKFGLANAVNCGDYLHGKVYEAICSLTTLGMDERKVIKLLIEVNYAVGETGEGQALEISSRSKTDLTYSDYENIVQKKTGAYLTLPIIGAAIISDCSDTLIESIRTYGRYVGPAFQIQDDLIDLTEGKGRGEIGCDIREGKRSYLVATLSQVCLPSEKAWLFSILNKPRMEKTDLDVKEIIELLMKYNIADTAKKKVSELIELGKKSIDSSPVELRKLLEKFADFTINRKD